MKGMRNEGGGEDEPALRLPTFSLKMMKIDIFKFMSGTLKDLVIQGDIKNAGIMITDSKRFAEISANCNPHFFRQGAVWLPWRVNLQFRKELTTELVLT